MTDNVSIQARVSHLLCCNIIYRACNWSCVIWTILSIMMNAGITDTVLTFAERLGGGRMAVNQTDVDELQTRSISRPKRIVCLAAFIVIIFSILYTMNLLTSFFTKLAENKRFIAQISNALSHRLSYNVSNPS